MARFVCMQKSRDFHVGFSKSHLVFMIFPVLAWAPFAVSVSYLLIWLFVCVDRWLSFVVHRERTGDSAPIPASSNRMTSFCVCRPPSTTLLLLVVLLMSSVQGLSALISLQSEQLLPITLNNILPNTSFNTSRITVVASLIFPPNS